MSRLRIAAVALMVLAACTSKDEATQWMKGYPVHDVKVGGYAFFTCLSNQRVGRNYTAIDNQTGARVQGTVCTNLFNDVADVSRNEIQK